MLAVILIGLAALSVLLLTHELGHFFTAKATGVKVEEFGIGFPPRLFGVRRGETLYSLNAIPFGGFNKMAGEEDPGVPRGLASKGIGTRLLVLSAGSLMNILLAFLLFSIIFMVPTNVEVGQVVVTEVAPDSPASLAGIEAGDVISSIDDKPVHNISDLHREVLPSLGKKTTLVLSNATTREVELVPRWNPPEGQGAIGITVELKNSTVVRQSYPFWEAIPKGMGEFADTLVVYKNGIMSVFTGVSAAEFVGPVGLVQLTGEVAVKAGIRQLLEAAGLISFLLGIFNLFPLPAIDGGRITFVLLEWVRRGRRISPKTEGLVHAIGFFLLIAVLLVVTYQDIVRIVSGGSFIP
jgi:regulator of sigma E protease